MMVVMKPLHFKQAACKQNFHIFTGATPGMWGAALRFGCGLHVRICGAARHRVGWLLGRCSHCLSNDTPKIL